MLCAQNEVVFTQSDEKHYEYSGEGSICCLYLAYTYASMYVYRMYYVLHIANGIRFNVLISYCTMVGLQ